MLNQSLNYTVTLPVFEGPLDLLLRLIEREELDITRVALAQVADQYLAHVRSLESPDPAALSAFLVIAARLLVIKSRALLPRPSSTASEQPDDGDELVRQLQEYQRYKQVASLLRQLEADGRRSYVRAAAPQLPRPTSPQRLDVTLAEMLAAVQRRVQLLLPIEPPPTPMPTPRVVTVADIADQLRTRLQRQAWVAFDDLLSTTVRRVEVIVALWAVLELLKRQAIVVEQPELFGPIMIGRGPNLSAADLHTLEVGEQAA